MRTIYSLLVLAALALVGLFYYLDKLEGKDIGIGVLAMLGTLLGATLAFRLNESKEATKSSSEARAALNRALFILARQQNALILIAKQLEPFQTDGELAFNLPAAKVPTYEDLTHDFRALEFLLETSDANSLMQLTVEQ